MVLLSVKCKFTLQIRGALELGKVKYLAMKLEKNKQKKVSLVVWGKSGKDEAVNAGPVAEHSIKGFLMAGIISSSSNMSNVIDHLI